MSCNLKIVFTLAARVNFFFTVKDKLQKMLLSGLFYKYKCCGCNAICYGNTKRYFKVRIFQHLGISHLTGKKVKIVNNKLRTTQKHLSSRKYSPSFEEVFILTRENNVFELKIMERLLIAREPVLNKGNSSLTLKLF